MKKLAFVLAPVLFACGNAGGADGSDVATACSTGAIRACKCSNGASSTQSCAPDGSRWQACKCSLLNDAGADVAHDGPLSCGDHFCDPGETCTECPIDCGQCAECNLAPGCTGAFAVPTQSTALGSFDNAGRTIYSCGDALGTPAAQTSCADPQLKIRVSDLAIHGAGQDTVELFCIISADDGQSSELVVTPKAAGVADGQSLPLSQGSGMFWGQDAGKVKLTQFNVTIQYNCYELTQPSQWSSILSTIGGAAGAIGSVPGNPYGWAFGLGGIAAQAAAAAVSNTTGTELRLSVQQTISKDAFLDMTNARTWSIRQSGKVKTNNTCVPIFGEDCLNTWDWELHVQAWGCADPRPGGTPAH